jgi:hypothetical protein
MVATGIAWNTLQLALKRLQLSANTVSSLSALCMIYKQRDKNNKY